MRHFSAQVFTVKLSVHRSPGGNQATFYAKLLRPWRNNI
jgi:hypothetical protein